MARKKVNLVYITNDQVRKSTFKKRKKGVMKKVHELATLCGVAACAIVWEPNSDPQPEAWPSPGGAAEVLERFHKLPEMERRRKTTDQEGFLLQQVSKLAEQLQKRERENRELRISILMHEALAGMDLRETPIGDLTSLSWMAEMKVKAVNRRIKALKAQMEREAAVAAAAAERRIQMEVMDACRLGGYNSLIDEYMGLGGGHDLLQQPYMDQSNPWADALFFN